MFWLGTSSILLSTYLKHLAVLGPAIPQPLCNSHLAQFTKSIWPSDIFNNLFALFVGLVIMNL